MLYIPFQDIIFKDFWSKLLLIGFFRNIIDEFNRELKKLDTGHHFS